MGVGDKTPKETQEKVGESWPLMEAAEGMRSGQVLEVFCSIGQQDILTDATWGVRHRELLRMTAMFST